MFDYGLIMSIGRVNLNGIDFFIINQMHVQCSNEESGMVCTPLDVINPFGVSHKNVIVVADDA